MQRTVSDEFTAFPLPPYILFLIPLKDSLLDGGEKFITTISAWMDKDADSFIPRGNSYWTERCDGKLAEAKPGKGQTGFALMLFF